MRESKIEDKLKENIERMGGMCIKLWPVSLSGIPDRIVLMPMGRIWFVELKAPGKKPRTLQNFWHRQLAALGFKVRVVSNFLELDNFIYEIKFKIPV